MNRKRQIVYLILLTVGLILVTTAFFLGQRVSVAHPSGLVAIEERNILILATLLMLIVVIPVFILTFVFAWKYHKENKEAKYKPEWDYSLTLETLWWGIPLIIIAILSVITWKKTHELDPFKPIESNIKPINIQVVALDWKWLFLYPEQQIATVNYFQFPTNTPVSFAITAEAPMNSFWIPALSGQIFAMPKMRTELHIISDKVGSYRGSSANLSGKGFAGMTFVAEAAEEEDFEKWVESVKSSKEVLNWESYKELAEPSENNPRAFYQLEDVNLFDQIIEQYLKKPFSVREVE